MKKLGIVFFDFDGTLIKADSFSLFAKFAVGKRLFYSALFRTMPYIIRWKLGLLSNSKAKEYLFFNLYKGRSRAWFEEKGQEFMRLIDNHLRTDTIALLEEYKGKRFEICIVTASLSQWVEPWAAAHSINYVLSTEAAFDKEDNLTGKFATPNCHGEEKVRRISERFPQLRTEYSQIHAFGDSRGDLPMIRFAGSGRLV